LGVFNTSVFGRQKIKLVTTRITALVPIYILTLPLKITIINQYL